MASKEPIYRLFLGRGNPEPGILAPSDARIAETVELVRLPEGHSPYRLKVSPDGSSLAAGTRWKDAGGMCRIVAWNLDGLPERRQPPLLDTSLRSPEVLAIEFMTPGLLAVSTPLEGLSFYAIPSPNAHPVAVIPSPESLARDLASLAPTLLATIGDDAVLRIIDLDAARVIHKQEFCRGSIVPQISFVQESGVLYVLDGSGRLSALRLEVPMQPSTADPTLLEPVPGALHSSPVSLPTITEPLAAFVLGAETMLGVSADGARILHMPLEGAGSCQAVSCPAPVLLNRLIRSCCAVSNSDFAFLHLADRRMSLRIWQIGPSGLMPGQGSQPVDVRSIAGLPRPLLLAEEHKREEAERMDLLDRARKMVATASADDFVRLCDELANRGLVEESLLLLAESYRIHNLPLRELACRLQQVCMLPEGSGGAPHFYALADLLQTVLGEKALAREWFERAEKAQSGFADAAHRAAALSAEVRWQPPESPVRLDIPSAVRYAQELEKAMILEDPLPLRIGLHQWPVRTSASAEQLAAGWPTLCESLTRTASGVQATARVESIWARPAEGPPCQVEWLVLESVVPSLPLALAVEARADEDNPGLLLVDLFEGGAVLRRESISETEASVSVLAEEFARLDSRPEVQAWRNACLRFVEATTLAWQKQVVAQKKYDF